LKGGVTLDAGMQDALLWWIDQAGEQGICTQELSTRGGIHLEQLNHELQKLEIEGEVVCLETGNAGMFRWISPATYRRVAERLSLTLTKYRQTELFSPGMPKAVMLEQVFNGKHVSPATANAYLGLLQTQSKIVVQSDLVTSVITPEIALQREERILDTMNSHIEQAGLEMISSEVLREKLSLSSVVLQRALQRLLREGRVLALPNGLFAHASAITKVCTELRKHQCTRFTVPEFKARFGLTRRTAIPLLEYLDAIGVTERVGDQRMVVNS
jgi:selenocysteine-specific elongation factor